MRRMRTIAIVDERDTEWPMNGPVWMYETCPAGEELEGTTTKENDMPIDVTHELETEKLERPRMVTHSAAGASASVSPRSPGLKKGPTGFQLPVLQRKSGGPSPTVETASQPLLDSSKLLKFVEIFESVKGEGMQAGVPMMFIRFATCNLSCDFCDTPYNRVGIRMTVDELVEYVRGRHPSWVIFTGGEPMVQLNREITSQLKDVGIKMAIETNGMIYNDAMLDLDYINISPKVCYNSPDNIIPVEKRIAPKLIEAIRRGEIEVDEVRHIICGPKDEIAQLPEGMKSKWTTISPLMYDCEEIPENWESGQGHRGMYGIVDQAAFNRCMQIVHQHRHDNFRISTQVHKFVGVR